MDFYKIKETQTKKAIIVAPHFLVKRSKDFMVRGKSFYAIWDDEKKLWSTNEFDVQKIIDDDVDSYIQERSEHSDLKYSPLYLADFKSNTWKEYRHYIGLMPDTNKQLDSKLAFLNDEVKKSDYSSKRLPYDLKKGTIKNYEELINTLFNPEEREKLEWAVGSIFAGDSKYIQKFIILYGEGGTGKSTFLNIVEKLFEGYCVPFDAKSLTNNSNAFSTEMFKTDPLVAIQHDGDLSRIADNTKLNSIVSHETITVNEKFKPTYTTRVNTFLFMGTNSPVMITDSRSGIIRRLIDVYPSGNKVPSRKYYNLMDSINFELGAIAEHCLSVYLKLGKNYYNAYKPLGMMYKTDLFYNFVEDSYLLFSEQDGCSLRQAYDLYKEYCNDSSINALLPKYKFKSELRTYFESFEERGRDEEGKQIRNLYSGFIKDKFLNKELKVEIEEPLSLVLDCTESVFDKECCDYYAQYANEKERPLEKWSNVTTTLKDIDTRKLHYVAMPLTHIVIDFDLKDEKGKKSLLKNCIAASSWPSTYSELSKSGEGVHLHYIYDGDPMELSNVYADNIEIKVFVGKSSLRRKLSACNNRPIAHISGGLPLKGGTKIVNEKVIKSEQGLRELIKRNLNKEYHPGTKPSIDFIFKILEEANAEGLIYDVSDMRTKVLGFAMNSTNQSEYCVELVSKMIFKSSTEEDEESAQIHHKYDEKQPIVFFDVEVFPNLFVVVLKEEGKEPVSFINPTSKDIEYMMSLKLIGFNNRRYDNHILYGCFIGYDNLQLYKLSKKIINNAQGGTFREAYNLSYTDIYDYSSKKQSLKKFEIELGIHHQELSFDWDTPVDEEHWPLVVEYCINDVLATEQVHKARKQDFVARLILASLSKLSPNNTTQQHTAKIIFGNERNPQKQFVYTDLSEMFPGYTYDPMRKPKSLYNGEEPSEGGYVYANPGMYEDVALLDIQSMHPTSLIILNAFGPYTDNYKQLMDARLAIKHKKYDEAKNMLGGILKPYLDSTENAKALSYSLKIVINIVYGLTSASFENVFLDPRNKDNIIAKRGALFMIDLKNAAESRGYKVVHIKTDSIKIANATQEAIDFVSNFGEKYGYKFEHEATYEKMCLINDAVYIAKYGWAEESNLVGTWCAVGAQFAHPYVFKKLFSKEEITFKDLCETKSVTSVMYLDFNEDLEDGRHNYVHVGKVGSFVPAKPYSGGGELFRVKDNKFYCVSGTKGYRWLEAENVKDNFDIIDYSYFNNLLDASITTLNKYGNTDWFIEK